MRLFQQLLRASVPTGCTACYEIGANLTIPTALSAAVAAPLPLERQEILLTWKQRDKREFDKVTILGMTGWL